MKKFVNRFSACLTALTVSAFSAGLCIPASAEIITDNAELPPMEELEWLGGKTGLTLNDEFILELEQPKYHAYSGYYIVSDFGSGIESIDLEIGSYTLLGDYYSRYINSLPTIYPESETPYTLYQPEGAFNGKPLSQTPDLISVSVQLVHCAEDADPDDLTYSLNVYGWTPELEVAYYSYFGEYDENGDELEPEAPGTVPEYELTLSPLTPTSLPLGSSFSPSDLHILLQETWEHRVICYDVSDYVYALEEPDMDTPGDKNVTLVTWYRTPTGGGRGLSVDYAFTVEEPEKTTMPILTGTNVTQQTSTNTTYEIITETYTATTTDSPYYPEVSFWITDPDGNTYPRGTNAFIDAYLSIQSYPRQEFAVGEPLDFTGLTVVLTEQRSYNQKDYDVTGYLKIQTDYDPNTPGTYTVYLSTDYSPNPDAAYEKVISDAVLQYQVTVSDSMTTAPITGTYYTLMTQPTSTLMGDADMNGEVEIMDAIMLARLVAEDKEVKITEQGKTNCDMDQNGNWNTDDLIILLENLAGYKG